MLKKIMSFRMFSTKIEIKESLIKQSTDINVALKTLLPIPSISIIRTVDQANFVVSILRKLQDRFHAWDTETIDVDPKTQSPVSHGKILCMSCFVGPDVDFGNGPSKISLN